MDKKKEPVESPTGRQIWTARQYEIVLAKVQNSLIELDNWLPFLEKITQTSEDFDKKGLSRPKATITIWHAISKAQESARNLFYITERKENSDDEEER